MRSGGFSGATKYQRNSDGKVEQGAVIGDVLTSRLSGE
ncbi:hypothetical protein XOCgx_4318 [Xanthomonas oryzae pv. oryzicola]|nr:hypothetical protein XOCgx_4318 [Xanthomonas oryzae pv. oryzicola]